MSAQIIDLAAYRRAKTKRKHAPTCGACGKPGHYYRTCTDHEAIERWNERQAAYWARRHAELVADIEARRERGAP